MSLRIVESYLKRNPCFKAGKKIQVKGLMLHSVGCSQPKASVFISSWNKESFGSACVHAFIDGNDGIVYQTLPWNHRGWHCASGVKGSGNNFLIGVEMCEPACIVYSGGGRFSCKDGKLGEAKVVVKRTYESAVELFAFLCKEFGLDPMGDGVIVSHKEGYVRGIASNHGDPEHLWNGLGMGYSMDGFRRDVKKAMKMENTDPDVTESTDVVNEFPSVPFVVRVHISDLNYRKEPKMADNVLGQTGKGSFTIVEVKDGWGRLKSGAGWIWLRNQKYCTVKK